MIDLGHILVPTGASEGSRRAVRHALAVAERRGATVTALRRLPEGQATTRPADLVVLEGSEWGRGGGQRAAAEAALRAPGVPVLVITPQSRRGPEPEGFHRIVCAVDLGSSVGRAAEYAVGLAAEDAHLTLVHVLEGFPPEEVEAARAGLDLGVYWSYRDAHARESLGELAAACGHRCRTGLSVTSGEPWLEILDVAAARDADLIVIEAPRGAAIPPGGTASRLVEQAACPVLLVPRR
jgi:nucleotide-binding universal stress UspA family protein